MYFVDDTIEINAVSNKNTFISQAYIFLGINTALMQKINIIDKK